MRETGLALKLQWQTPSFCYHTEEQNSYLGIRLFYKWIYIWKFSFLKLVKSFYSYVFTSSVW